jgi:GTP-binding protein HflX
VKEIPNPKLPRALLVSVRTPEVTDVEADESLAELERLVTTLGFRVVGTQSQRRPSTAGSTVIGEGKLKEISRLTGGPGHVERVAPKKNKAALRREAEEDEAAPEETEGGLAVGEAELPPENERPNIVVFDCDLGPSQLRNLQKALGVEILDRTGVIIEIFSRHAKTRAARLQVEIARLNYLAPRLRETGGGGGERQAGRGAGESELELDRRRIRDRVTELKAELVSVQKEQVNRRAQRSEQRGVALVGYTNAGKSSTMRALTGSEVLVQDKLFATLDTTVRALQPETHPRILISDTVGFIKKLPHDLVASFRSTLDEAHNASLLLYVVDAADPTFRSQLEVTREVLGEVGVEDTPSYLVLNKADRLEEDEKKALLREFPDAILMSTRRPEDVRRLREAIIAHFEKGMAEEEIFARYDVPGLIGEIRNRMRVVQENFENDGVRLKVRAPHEELARLRKKFPI